LTAFWADMAQKLFWNVNILYEQIETHYVDKAPGDGPGAQMAVSANNQILDVPRLTNSIQAFCFYTCGVLACYPCKFPNSKSRILVPH
jgi:hypothetical protein